MDSGAEAMNFMSRLPDELLFLVLAHVSYKDLCRIGCVCQRLHYLSHNNILWKRLCHIHWLDTPPIEDCSDGESPAVWYRTFQQRYQHMGQCIDCYSTVKGHWNRIEAAFKERRATDILESLRGPTQEENEVLAEAQELYLPADLLCSLHIHDGQETFYGDERMLGLGGLLRVYNIQSCPVLLSHGAMVGQLRQLKDELAEEKKEQLLHTVTVLECPSSRISIRMCLNSTGEFRTGNMFYCHSNSVTKYSFGRPHEGFFLLAESFTSWLAQLADRLSDPGTLFHKSSLSRFYLEPSCVAMTEHVKVFVATAFVPEMNEKPHRRDRKIFAYFITMAMDENTPRRKSCVLRTRHWVIRDSNGRVETAEGAGVVGNFPIMQPGTTHTWASYTSFATPSGSMGGHFGMVNLETQEAFNVKCPDFHMKALPFLQLEKCSEDEVKDD